MRPTELKVAHRFVPKGVAVELHCLPTARAKTKARPLRSQPHRGKEMGTGTDIYQHARPRTYKEQLIATRKVWENKLWKMVKDREAWRAAVHGVAKT